MHYEWIKDIGAATIMRYHDGTLAPRPDPGSRHGDGSAAWQWIEENHRCNILLWNEEDKARRTDVPDSCIASCKRRIDRYNQQRNDAVEAIDQRLLQALDGVHRRSDARLHSETAGAMIDRLSILALKIHHMRIHMERPDALPEHMGRCRARLGGLVEQRGDLARCFDALIAGTALGMVYFKVYRQYQMYNDPALNPYLSGKPSGLAA